MTLKEKIYFHDSTLIRFFKKNKRVVLCCEDVDVEGHGDADGIKKTVELTLDSVETVEMDGLFIDGPELMLESDGHIFNIIFLEDGIKMLVKWNDFKNRKSYMRGYTVIGDVSLRCLD